MEADILPIQYEVLNVFIWDKISFNSFQLTVYTGNLFATSKWNEHVTVHKIVLMVCYYVSGYLSYACRDEFVNCSWKINNRGSYSFASQAKWDFL